MIYLYRDYGVIYKKDYPYYINDDELNPGVYRTREGACQAMYASIIDRMYNHNNIQLTVYQPPTIDEDGLISSKVRHFTSAEAFKKYVRNNSSIDKVYLRYDDDKGNYLGKFEWQIFEEDIR